ncbi:MAG TPA: O-antigen ligase family protein [Candidatus Angelobacter sp.]|nr:O-antigen ligase family protein [Candidatus Angelobacter sp.]
MKTVSSAPSLPNPTPILFLITAIALLLWPDAVGMTALVVAGAIAIPIAMVGMMKSPLVAIATLLAASAMPRIFIEIGGLKARPEHIVGGVMLCLVPLFRRKRERPVEWITPDYWLFGYIALIFVSSVLMSIEPKQTTKWAVQQALGIVPYFILRVLITDRERFRWAFRALLAVGAAASAYAILCFYSYTFFGTALGVEVEQYEGGVAATYGVQFEANILGAYSGALAVMMLVMYLWEGRRRYLIGCSFFGLIGMAISLSRAALIATLMAVALAALTAFIWKRLTWKAAVNFAAASLVALLLVAPFILRHYTERFSTVELSDPMSDSNTLTRAVQTVSAVDEIMKHPIFGGGTASFQLVFYWEALGTDWENQGWIGNTELRVLHDTGAVGLLTFVIFLGSLVWQAIKTLKRETSPELIALLAGGAVYCVTFQATEGTLLAFSWVHVGLIGCAVAIMGRQEKQGNEIGELASS